MLIILLVCAMTVLWKVCEVESVLSHSTDYSEYENAKHGVKTV